MPNTLRVGTVLYGYCRGYFGRDSYEPKRVEAIGADWIVARDDAGRPVVAILRDGETVEDFVEEIGGEAFQDARDDG